MQNASMKESRDFHPLEIFTSLSSAFEKFICIFEIYLKLPNGCAHAGHTQQIIAIVFAAAHLQVTYTSDVLFFTGLVLILGLIWGFLMYYTKSIIASMLFHAGADLVIIIPVYSTFGVSI